ncbi:hypothetical protein ACTA71_009312 [Dictyostelium dimigraforme]
MYFTISKTTPQSNVNNTTDSSILWVFEKGWIKIEEICVIPYVLLTIFIIFKFDKILIIIYIGCFIIRYFIGSFNIQISIFQINIPLRGKRQILSIADTGLVVIVSFEIQIIQCHLMINIVVIQLNNVQNIQLLKVYRDELYNENNICSFSSKGPTHDGRMKPDIVAPGQYITSARSNGANSTDQCGDGSLPNTNTSGTSTATPLATVATTILRQYLVDGYFPTGSVVEH